MALNIISQLADGYMEATIPRELVIRFLELLVDKSSEDNLNKYAAVIVLLLSPVNYNYSQLLERKLDSAKCSFVSELFCKLYETTDYFSLQDLLKLMDLVEHEQDDVGWPTLELVYAMETAIMKHHAAIPMSTMKLIVEMSAKTLNDDMGYTLMLAITRDTALDADMSHTMSTKCMEELKKGAGSSQLLTALTILSNLVELSFDGVMGYVEQMVPLLLTIMARTEDDIKKLKKGNLYSLQAPTPVAPTDDMELSSATTTTTSASGGKPKSSKRSRRRRRGSSSSDSDMSDDDEDDRRSTGSNGSSSDSGSDLELDELDEDGIRQLSVELLELMASKSQELVCDLVIKHGVNNHHAMDSKLQQEAALLALGAIGSYVAGYYEHSTRVLDFVLQVGCADAADGEGDGDGDGDKMIEAEAMRCTAVSAIGKMSALSSRYSENCMQCLCNALVAPRCSIKYTQEALNAVNELLRMTILFSPLPISCLETLYETLVVLSAKPNQYNRALVNLNEAVIESAAHLPDSDLPAKMVTDIDQLVKRLNRRSTNEANTSFLNVLAELGRKKSLKALTPGFLEVYLLPRLAQVDRSHVVDPNETDLKLVEATNRCLKNLEKEANRYITKGLLNLAMKWTESGNDDSMEKGVSALYVFHNLIDDNCPSWLSSKIPKIMQTLTRIIKNDNSTVSVLTMNEAYYSFAALASALPQMTVLNYAEDVIDAIVKSGVVIHRILRAGVLSALSHLAIAAPQYTASRVPEFWDNFYELVRDEAVQPRDDNVTIKALVNLISFNMTLGYFYCDASSFAGVTVNQILSRYQHEAESDDSDEDDDDEDDQPSFKRRKLSSSSSNPTATSTAAAARVTRAIQLLMTYKLNDVPSNYAYDVARILGHFKARAPTSYWTELSELFPAIRSYLRMLPMFSMKPAVLEDITIRVQE